MEKGGDKRISILTPERLLGPLNDIEALNAPPELYVAGEYELPLPRPRVSVVGTRRVTPEGLKATNEIARFLARNDITVVSGLAKGVDTAAHWAAINEGGRTVAVLGTPLERAYPAENKPLQDIIASRHCAISQFRNGSTVHKGNFIVRNRTMALVSNASVIVEAGETSGSLRQGWEALRLGRPLFIWHSVFNTSLDWPTKMLHYGAMKLNKPQEILPYLPPRERILVA